MYQKRNRNNRNSNSGKSSFGKSKRKSHFRGNSKNRFKNSKISHTRFVCKADPVTKSKPYIPVNKFEDFKINPILKSNILKRGYVNPTPIQDKAVPFVLKGRDVVGVANTGTGKTAAFLIPLINKIINNPNEKILILAPTRELALQINQEFVEFKRELRYYSVCCVGGVGIYNQINGLRRIHNVVIGTPGRVKDLVNRKVIHLEEFRTLVLDEADRMLDMGFVEDMRFLISKMSIKHQTLFFSATISKEIDKLIKEFLNNPETISVKTGDTSRNVDQNIVRVRNTEDKIISLENLLSKEEFLKVLIFGRTKHGVEKLCKVLTQSGFKAESIHGDKNQSRRQRALKSFRDNHSQVLVATDVAARGLDIPNVTHVINYDIPSTYDDYIHRIGRTGRGDKTGIALTFVN